MLFSKTTEYAIRAMVLLALEPDGKLVMVKAIAAELGLPAHFLAKILQALALRGLLVSSKGPKGGFQLLPEPENITLARIMDATGDRVEYPEFVSEKITDAIGNYLNTTTIATLAGAVRREEQRKRRAA
jgi:Rrf2 family protein